MAWQKARRIMDPTDDTASLPDIMSVALDAAGSDRKADAIKLLITDGGLTLTAALDRLTPARLPQIGDIMECSWGYEQTRVDFYQVVTVTAKTVTAREIAKRYVTHEGHGNATVMPVRDAFAPNEKPISRRFKFPTDTWRRDESKWRYSIRVTDYSHAHLWDGEACAESGEH